MKKILTSLSAVAVAVALGACSGYTESATNVSSTSATLNGEVSCSGGVPYGCYFGFTIDTVPISQAGLHGNPYAEGVDNQGPFYVNGSGQVSYNDTALQPNTTYYYELCGSGDTIDQTICTGQEQFTTS